MQQISFDIPDGVLASLHKNKSEFTDAVRLAAAAIWYEKGKISQGRAAELAGVSRSELINSLNSFGVSPFQETEEELLEIIKNG